MKTVLVVEDNLELRENTAEILELSGFKVLTCDSSSKGLEMAIRQHPDVIIYDSAFTPSDVLRFTSDFQNNESVNHTPVIILDGIVLTKPVRRAITSLQTVQLHKPFTREELLEAIHSCLDH